eukprot:1825620-Rhodomonas_salina.3
MACGYTRCPVLSQLMTLRAPYEMSGTELHTPGNQRQEPTFSVQIVLAFGGDGRQCPIVLGIWYAVPGPDIRQAATSRGNGVSGTDQGHQTARCYALSGINIGHFATPWYGMFGVNVGCSATIGTRCDVPSLAEKECTPSTPPPNQMQDL